MEKLIVKSIGGMRQITAQFNEKFNSVTFEENTVLHNGRIHTPGIRMNMVRTMYKVLTKGEEEKYPLTLMKIST